MVNSTINQNGNSSVEKREEIMMINDQLDVIYSDPDYGKMVDLVTGFSEKVEDVIKILEENKVCASHSLDHLFTVMLHSYKAYLSWASYICRNSHQSFDDVKECECVESAEKSQYYNKQHHELVLLAALLHDLDDQKFFPDNFNNENLRYVLRNEDDNIVDDVVILVRLVSCKTNLDNIPDWMDVKTNGWMLIPRYADRLDAIGERGIYRCYKYTKTIGRPVSTMVTFRPQSERDIWAVATTKRFKDYSGVSETMIDHYYDKLLNLSFFTLHIPYFEKKCKDARELMIEYLLYFGKTGIVLQDRDY